MSETTKHTPRPWHLHVDSVRFPFTVQNAASQCIAETGQNHYIEPSVHLANARLIAAAPELLEACRAACRAASDCLPPSGEGELDAGYYKAKLLAIDEAASQCSAAIAKAIGAEHAKAEGRQ